MAPYSLNSTFGDVLSMNMVRTGVILGRSFEVSITITTITIIITTITITIITITTSPSSPHHHHHHHSHYTPEVLYVAISTCWCVEQFELIALYNQASLHTKFFELLTFRIFLQISLEPCNLTTTNLLFCYSVLANSKSFISENCFHKILLCTSKIWSYAVDFLNLWLPLSWNS